MVGCFKVTSRAGFFVTPCRRAIVVVVAFIAIAVAPQSAPATTLFWSGAGAWDFNATQNWATVTAGPYNAAKWTSAADTATFEGTGGTVTVASTGIAVSAINFSVGGYTLTGGRIYIGSAITNNAVTGVNTINSTLELTGPTNISNTATDGSLIIAGSILNSGNLLTATATKNFTISGAISGSGGLTKTGAGTLTLSSPSYFTGTTLITTGRIILGDSRSLQYSTVSTSVNKGIDFGSLTSATIGGLIGTVNQTLLNNNGSGSPVTLTLGTSNAAATYSGILSGIGGNITKIGSATQTFSPAAGLPNTYTGATEIESGTLTLSYANIAAGTSTNALLSASSSLTLGGGTLNVTGKSGVNATQMFATTTISTGTSSITMTGIASTTQQLNLNAITRSAGGTINFSPGAAAVVPVITTDRANDGSNGGTSGNLGILGGWATYNASDWASKTLSGNDQAIGAFTGYITTTAPSGWNSADNISLDGSPSAAWSTRSLNSIKITSSSVFLPSAAGQAMTVTSGGILVNSGTLTLGTGGFSPVSQIKGSASGDLIFQGAGNATVNLLITDNGGATALTKSGSGTLTLNTSNSYTGANYINGGTVSIPSIGSAGASSTLGASSSAASNLVFNGGTLQYTGTSGSTDHGFTLNAGGGIISVGANALTFTGGATGPGGLRISASLGTVTLIGAYNYNGPTDIYGTGTNAATLTVGDGVTASNIGSATNRNVITVGNPTGAAGALNITANATVYGTQLIASNTGNIATITVAGTLDLIGDVTLAGSGGTFTQTGSSTVTANNLNISSAAGSTADTIYKQKGNSTATIGGNITLNDAASFHPYYLLGDNTGVTGPTLAYGQMITGTNASPSVAQFQFNKGTLKALSANLGFSNIKTSIETGGGTIDTNGFNITTGQNFLVGSTAGGGFTKTGAGTLTYTATGSTYTGSTSVTGGTLALSAASSNPLASSSGYIVGAGANLDVTGLTASSGRLILTGSQFLKGSGTVTGGVTAATNNTISPGASPGNLTITGGLNLSGGGSYIWELGAYKASDNVPNLAGGAGTDWDLITLTGGGLVLGGTSTLSINFTTIGNPNNGDAFWNTGHQWKVIDITGSATNAGTQFSGSPVNGAYTKGNFTFLLGTGADAGDIFVQYSVSDNSVFNPAVNPLNLGKYLLNQAAGVAGSMTLTNNGTTAGTYTTTPSGVTIAAGATGGAAGGSSVTPNLAFTTASAMNSSGGNVTVGTIGITSSAGNVTTLTINADVYEPISVTQNAGVITNAAATNLRATAQIISITSAANSDFAPAISAGASIAPGVGNSVTAVTMSNTATKLKGTHETIYNATIGYANEAINGAPSVGAVVTTFTNQLVTHVISSDIINTTAGLHTAQTANILGTDSVPSGQRYAGFSSTVAQGVIDDQINGNTTLGTTATLLAGGNTTDATQSISMTWRARKTSEINGHLLDSDAVDLSGVTGIFVFQMSFDTTAAQLNGQNPYTLFLGWLDERGVWENAVLGNSNHALGTRYISAWNSTASGGAHSTMHLGDYGLDVNNHTVWAVLDHNSEFAVIPAPLALPGGLMLLSIVGVLRRRRPAISSD